MSHFINLTQIKGVLNNIQPIKEIEEGFIAAGLRGMNPDQQLEQQGVIHSRSPRHRIDKIGQ